MTTFSTSANKHAAADAGSKAWRWTIWLLYAALSLWVMWHHELWADELHSWNIARESNSLIELVHNMRYEGHPAGWLALLWAIARFTHDPFAMQMAQWLIAVLVVYLVLFHSRMPLLMKALVPFGYYFLFEYAILSRNYGLGVLLAFLLCIVLRKEFRYKYLCYYTLLFLLSNVHLLTLLLAGSLHLYFLLSLAEQGKKKSGLLVHVLLAGIVFLPAAWCIAAPSGSGPTVALLISKTGISQLAIMAQAPLRAFVPIPAWWQYHCWNSQFLLELQLHYRTLKFLSPLLSALLLGWAWYLLKGSKKSRIVFLANIVVTVMVGVVFTLHTERYAGFIFIGFLVACWLYYNERPAGKTNKGGIIVLLVIQLLAGLFFAIKDIREPFSRMDKVKELVAMVPAGSKVITDYRTVNAVSAYLDQPMYCLDQRRAVPFVLWEPDMHMLNRYKYRYTEGLDWFFKQQGGHEVYMLSCGSPETLQLTDALLFTTFHVQLMHSYPAPIDKESNVYLYKITRTP